MMRMGDSFGKSTDVLIIGGGLAGQTAALNLAETHKVLLACKKDLTTSASSRAQGGISAVFMEPDSHDKHLQDTLAGHVRRHPNITVLEHHTAVELLVAKSDARACAGALLIGDCGECAAKAAS